MPVLILFLIAVAIALAIAGVGMVVGAVGGRISEANPKHGVMRVAVTVVGVLLMGLAAGIGAIAIPAARQATQPPPPCTWTGRC